MFTRLCLAGVALMLTGCATYDWKLAAPPSTDIRWVQAPLAILQSFPGCEWSIACAIRFTGGACVVITTTTREETPKEIADHEAGDPAITGKPSHCFGYDHQ